MKPIVRILIVTDDFGAGGNPQRGGFLRWQDQSDTAAIGASSREFHLGEFCQCLQNTSWVGFDISLTRAHRAVPGTNGLDEAALKADRGADIVGFRFDQSFAADGQTRTLGDYDMVLFFPINPANPNSELASEIDAIARFMENGGGFFATGDHQNLGSELCGLIPRVRSMRRWWFPMLGPHGEPVAPSALEPDRHDTTRSGPDNVTNFEDQSDDIAQEMTPLLYAAGYTVRGGYPARRYLPHPLLCSPDGIVTWLPDHMHEGSCEVPTDLATRNFNIGAQSFREYPDYTPASPPPGYVPTALAPEVIATGKVLPGTTSPALDTVHTGGTVPATGTTFGVIGAWDGHLVNKGRVVVDSTWHHFFNINLSGDRYLENDSLPEDQLQKLHGFYVPDGNGGRKPNDAYRMIMWYYRNIVYWLIPAQRHETLWWQTLADLMVRPRLSEELMPLTASGTYKNLTLDYFHYFGQLAERYLEKARGFCATYEIHKYIYEPKIPWWEWIQHIVDIWDPVQKPKLGSPADRAQWLGAIGAAPPPQVGATLSLGAALVAVAAVRLDLAKGADTPEATRSLKAVWPEVLNLAVGQFATQLRSGAELTRDFEKIAREQVESSRHH